MTNGKGGGETTRLFTPLCSSSRTMRAHRSQWKAGRFSTLSPTAFAQRLRGRRKRPTVRTSALEAARIRFGNTSAVALLVGIAWHSRQFFWEGGRIFCTALTVVGDGSKGKGKIT